MKIDHHGIGRRRDRLIVDRLLLAATRNGGSITRDGDLDEAVCLYAVNAVYRRRVGAEAAREIVRKKLDSPRIRAALRGVC